MRMTATLRREIQVTEKIVNHVPSALPADHEFECEVVSIESPEIKRFSVNMNKKHWNTVTLDGSVPDDEVRQMIDESYALVVAGMTRAKQIQLRKLG